MPSTKAYNKVSMMNSVARRTQNQASRASKIPSSSDDERRGIQEREVAKGGHCRYGTAEAVGVISRL